MCFGTVLRRQFSRRNLFKASYETTIYLKECLRQSGRLKDDDINRRAVKKALQGKHVIVERSCTKHEVHGVWLWYGKMSWLKIVTITILVLALLFLSLWYSSSDSRA